jgi:hypothetical protein
MRKIMAQQAMSQIAIGRSVRAALGAAAAEIAREDKESLPAD